MTPQAEKNDAIWNNLKGLILALICLTILSACEPDSSAGLQDPRRYVKDIDSLEHFNQVVKSAGDRLLVFEFYADWCRPCKDLEPILENIARENGEESDFYRVDLESLDSVSRIFKVRGIPYVAFIKDETIVFSLTGLHPKSKYVDAIKSFTN